MSKKKATKETLLDSAIYLFQQHGFENVTIDDICKEINVTKTAFYYHYKSKDELIRDYFSTDNMLSNNELVLILGAQDYATQVLRIMEIRINHITKAGVALTKELYRVYLKDEVIPLLGEETGLSDIILQLIGRAQEAGQMKTTESPEVVHSSLCCLLNGVALKWIVAAGSFDIVDEFHRLCGAVFL